MKKRREGRDEEKWSSGALLWGWLSGGALEEGVGELLEVSNSWHAWWREKERSDAWSGDGPSITHIPTANINNII